MFNMFLVKVTLAPFKSFIFYLLIQNGDVYMADELPCKYFALC